MKKLFAALMLVTLTSPAQAVLLPAGSPRPIESAQLNIVEADGIFEGINSAFLTRVRYERTGAQGFVLEVTNNLGLNKLVFNVTDVATGSCGEKIYYAIAPTFAAGRPSLTVVDHREDHCDYWTEVADWDIEVTTLDRRASSFRAQGEPSPIFTPMSVQRGFDPKKFLN
jgi:hypothetical protein